MYVRILMTFTINMVAPIFPLYDHWRMVEIVLNNDYNERRWGRGWHIDEDKIIIGLALFNIIENAIRCIECRHKLCNDGLKLVSVGLLNLGQSLTNDNYERG